MTASPKFFSSSAKRYLLRPICLLGVICILNKLIDFCKYLSQCLLFLFLFAKCDTGLGQGQGGSFPNLLPSKSGKTFVEDITF